MIRIIYQGRNENLRLAVNSVNNLLQQDYFYHGIEKHSGFDMCTISANELASLMRTVDVSMKINLYYSLSPFNKAVSFDDTNDPTVIHLNKWTLNRPVESICNTLMHHCVHAVNSCFPQFEFGHGDCNAEGKDNTAPYWIAGYAQRILADDMSVYEAMDHEEVNNLPFLKQFYSVHTPAKRMLPLF